MPKDRNIVLVVDDDQAIVRACTMALAGAGFRAMVAENGVAGIEAFLHMADEICLVVIDVMMPIMDGQKMAATVLEHAPDTKILLMSGYSDSVLTLAGKQEFPFIRKPFLLGDFIRKVNEVLAPSDRYGAGLSN